MSVQERKPVPRAHEPRLLAHPFEVCTAVLFITSALSLGKYLLDDVRMHEGIGVLPDWILWAWVAMLGAGGPAVIAGVLLGTRRTWGRATERAGLWLSGPAWATAGLATVWVTPGDVLGWLPIVSVAAACVLRLVALARLERVVDKVAEVKRQDTET